LKTSLRVFLAAAALVACVAVARAADADTGSGGKVNINQASAAQLALLPRVGARAADRIVEYRKAHGAFGQAEQLMEVKGVGEKLFTELKPFVTLTGPTTLTAKVRSGAPRPRNRTGASGKKSASASNSVPVGKGW
jgi:competence protein ComEA